MNWQNNDLFDEDDELKAQKLEDNQSSHSTVDEKEISKLIQLKKFQDPTKDAERQAYMTILNRFAEILAKEGLEGVSKTLMTEECEVFLFNCVKKSPVKYATGQQGFVDLNKDREIKDRVVKETFIDVEKNTACQICLCKIFYYDANKEEEEITFEIFTIIDSKISKYRASFAKLTGVSEKENPIILSKRDKMLAKVKEINYCLAGEPDVVKMTSLFYEKTEYRLWSWDDRKCFNFYKHNLVTEFSNLQENMKITCVVPYEIFTDRDFVIGTYVYYLEDKAGQKFVWLSTCVYEFDNDANISKMSQQGDLFPEDEAQVEFEVFSRKKLLEKTSLVFGKLKPTYDAVYDNTVKFDCQICRLSPFMPQRSGGAEGYNNMDAKTLERIANLIQLEWVKAVDTFVDFNDPSYEVVISVTCSQGILNFENYENKGKRMNYIIFSKFSFENGKVAKSLQLKSEILEPIPTPFDDKSFTALYVKQKEEVSEDPNSTRV